jgi:hypothetical protein
MKTAEEAWQEFDQNTCGHSVRAGEVKRLSRTRFQPSGLRGKLLHEHVKLSGQFCSFRWRRVGDFRETWTRRCHHTRIWALVG